MPHALNASQHFTCLTMLAHSAAVRSTTATIAAMLILLSIVPFAMLAKPIICRQTIEQNASYALLSSAIAPHAMSTLLAMSAMVIHIVTLLEQVAPYAVQALLTVLLVLLMILVLMSFARAAAAFTSKITHVSIAQLLYKTAPAATSPLKHALNAQQDTILPTMALNASLAMELYLTVPLARLPHPMPIPLVKVATINIS